MAKISEKQGRVSVEFALGVVKIEEKGGLLHVNVFASAKKTVADAHVTLTVADFDAEQNLLWRSDAGMYSCNGQIFAVNKTHVPFEHTVIVGRR